MQIRRYSIVVFLLFSLAASCPAQAILTLDVTRITGFKRIKYYPGDEIYFKTAHHKRFKGSIVSMSDSVIYFENNNKVNIKDIEVIYRNNSNFVTRSLGKFCICFGPGFLCLDLINRGFKNRKPIYEDQALQQSAAFSASGLVFMNMMKHRYKIGKRRTIKILDLSIY